MNRRFLHFIVGSDEWTEPAGSRTALEAQHELSQDLLTNLTIRVIERVQRGRRERDRA